MGGAIAQEFVRQFPKRVSSLILCATMAGGSCAKYATADVVGVMRDPDGISPEEAARRIWKVTYAPGYLERHRDLAEEQMRREVALPTRLCTQPTCSFRHSPNSTARKHSATFVVLRWS
jgi:pimeloyl-ACP methyl ester carboxylesterase